MMEITESYLVSCFGKEVVEVYKNLFGEQEYKNFNSRFCGYYADEEEYTKYYYGITYLPIFEHQPVPSYTKYLETEYKDNFHYDPKTKALFRTGSVEELDHPWNQSLDFKL